MRFYDFLEQKRKELNKNTKDFLVLLGIKSSQYSFWRHNIGRASDETLERISKALNVDLSVIKSCEFGKPRTYYKDKKKSNSMFIPIENNLQENSNYEDIKNEPVLPLTPVSNSHNQESLRRHVETEIVPKNKTHIVVDADISISVSKDIPPEKLFKIFNLIKEI